MATLVLDTFTDADNTALTAHTPDKGGPWTAGVGTFKISSNKATPNSDADDDQVAIDCGQTSAVLTCDVVPTAILLTYNRAPGLMFRWQDSGHFYLLDINVFGVAANSMVLWIKNGTYSQLAAANPVLVSGSAYGIKVEFFGQTINVYLSGVLQFSYTTASQYSTSTKCGLRLGSGSALGGNADCTWDNFQVSLLDAPTVAATLSPIPGSPNFRLTQPPVSLTGATKTTARSAPPAAPGIILGPPMQGAPWFKTFPPREPVVGPPAVPGRGQYELPGVTSGPPRPGTPWFRVVQPAFTPPVAPPPPGPPLRTTRARPLLNRVPNLSDARRLAQHTEVLANMVNALVNLGQIQELSPTEWQIVSGGFAAIRPPGPNDDSRIGATPGCSWIDAAGSASYVCISNGVGSAVWHLMTTTNTGFTGTA